VVALPQLYYQNLICENAVCDMKAKLRVIKVGEALRFVHPFIKFRSFQSVIKWYNHVFKVVMFWENQVMTLTVIMACHM
jgi:hypothetical protein